MADDPAGNPPTTRFQRRRRAFGFNRNIERARKRGAGEAGGADWRTIMF